MRKSEPIIVKVNSKNNLDEVTLGDCIMMELLKLIERKHGVILTIPNRNEKAAVPGK